MTNKAKPSLLLSNLIKRSLIISDSALLETNLINNLANNLTESPQRLSNSLYYRMRVTGTGDVWRDSTGQTIRPGDKYINTEFLDRCIGLPIVQLHPEEEVLNTESKIVGTTVYSYVPPDLPDEVWCIARIIDGQAQDDLLTEKLSTSPSVVTSPSTGGHEGDPIYIDHLAIVPSGVWDHGGPPTGIDQEVMVDSSDNLITQEDEPISDSSDSDKQPSIKDIDMTPEEMKKMLGECLADALKPINDRMDRLETKADADDEEDKEVKADADEDKPEQEAAKEDAKEEGDKVNKIDVKADSDEDSETKQNAEIAALRAELADMKKASEPVADDEMAELADAHAMADSVARSFGKTAKMPMPGERAISYRKRMISQFKQYSPAWKGVDISTYNDSALIRNVETQVYADAQVASRKPSDLPKHSMREIRKDLGYGRQAVEFVGDSNAWMNEFKLRPAFGKFKPAVH